MEVSHEFSFSMKTRESRSFEREYVGGSGGLLREEKINDLIVQEDGQMDGLCQ